MLQSLPVGIQTFSELRRHDYFLCEQNGSHLPLTHNRERLPPIAPTPLWQAAHRFSDLNNRYDLTLGRSTATVLSYILQELPHDFAPYRPETEQYLEITCSALLEKIRAQHKPSAISGLNSGTPPCLPKLMRSNTGSIQSSSLSDTVTTPQVEQFYCFALATLAHQPLLNGYALYARLYLLAVLPVPCCFLPVLRV